MKTQSKNEQLLVLTDIIMVLAISNESNNQYAIFQESVPPLGGPPPHTHPDEEVFYILEGEFEFILNDLENPFKALPGSVVHVPSNAVHTFKNVGISPGKMIVILTPGNLLDFFRDIGHTLKGADDFPNLNEVPDFSKLDLSKVFKYAPKHQVNFILPEVIKN
ncbi:cupin domain-containing protein [Mariniflexile gromovii]|uniref:Cupin domain-containing protein n=1 Tax=Mariniflexile gromovii TaxID=362523 RepID=A0ABS4BU35_9FLAO|nr:cupin domain-containing protein [Mariniflexile gromovii]MBP0904072.1 cupin domain-containing protein [Mariniflexile gromovii]